MLCIKLLLVGLLITASVGCSTVQRPITPANALLHSTDTAFALIDKSGWAKSEWKKYLRDDGHKAFSVSVLEDGSIYAVGFASDMKSKYWAVVGAQNLCKYFSEGYGVCRVVDIQTNHTKTQLTPVQIGQAPLQLIRHRDIRSYYQYKEEHGPKTIVIANPSGSVNWVSGEQLSSMQALDACEQSMAEYDVSCEVLESED